MLSKSWTRRAGILVRQRLDQGRIHKGEYGHAGGNAKRDDEDCRGSEAGILAQLAQCKSKILRNCFPAECDEAVTLLADLRGVAELMRGRGVSFFRGDA